jgi:DNA-binding response OmpR family regulator
MANDGVAAWEEFQREPAPLVVLDVNMPAMNGLEVCRRIRAHPMGGETFVLVVTARDGRDDLVNVLAAGADDYVTKPSSPENLRARLEIARLRIGLDTARRAAEAELLLMDKGLTESQVEQLGIIQEQAARIAQVVRRLAKLKNPQSVEYLGGARMLDLSARPDRPERPD